MLPRLSLVWQYQIMYQQLTVTIQHVAATPMRAVQPWHVAMLAWHRIAAQAVQQFAAQHSKDTIVLSHSNSTVRSDNDHHDDAGQHSGQQQTATQS
jgi:hypothetical protein